MYPNVKAPSLFRRVSTSIFLGFAVAIVGALIEHLTQGMPFLSLAVLDDVVVGVITGLVVFVYEQRQHRALLKKVSMIAAMNHHVRNALQAIMYAPYTEQVKQIKLIEDSSKRIQWALNEILPGEMEEAKQLEDKSAER
jgi:signal transduction histidine kinase